jgi:DNA polymerase-3 subunit gamma/tau
MPTAEHRALALKYRPQVFTDIVGQEHVTEVLTRALASGRVAHAYLLTGPRGVGKTTTARILAKALNCERRDPRRPATASEKADGAPEPCNLCPSCRDITAGVAMDVAEIDGASNRGIADVQMLREKVRFTPAGGRFRVVIIDEVHQLSGDAFAALLKTLEEPPPHLAFVFATTDPLKLPDTIRSRCQRYDFARVPVRKVADRLRHIAEREAADPQGVHFTLEEGAALLLARQSEGALRDAVSALDQVVSTGETHVTDDLVRGVLGLPDHVVFFQLAEKVLARDAAASLKALHEAFAAGFEPRDLAEGLSEHLRNVLVLKTDPGATELIAASAEEIERIRQQGGDWTAGDLLRLLRLISDANFAMRDSAQPLLHLEAAVLQMASLEPGSTLAEILERLRELEARLEGSAPEGGAARRPGTAAPAGRGAPWSAGGAGMRRGPATGPPWSAGGPGAGAPRGSGAGPGGTWGGGPGASLESGPAAQPPPVAAPRPAGGEAAIPAVVGAPAGDAPPVAVAMPEASDSELAERWSQVLHGVNERKRMLGAFLSQSRLLAVGEGGLVLAMDDLHRAVLDDRENRALLGEEIERVFGARLPFSCTRPVAEAPRRPPTAADIQPLIERATQFFDGEAVQRSSRGGARNAPPERNRS